MSVRPDNRLADAPMQPVDCEACGARVLVRKSSWEQTSVQWDAASLALCDRRRDAMRTAQGFLSGCLALRESIESAVLQGNLRVLSDT
ncbi:ferredoxin [Mycobacterium sp. ZZG]